MTTLRPNNKKNKMDIDKHANTLDALLKKFQIYNSLFLNLSYQENNPIGHLLPLLTRFAKKRMEEGQSPVEILDAFILANKDLLGDDTISFLFKVIQYVERQVVLFDSVEDVISPASLEDKQIIHVKNLLQSADNQEDLQTLINKLNEFQVRIVLTAHPTQFYRPPVLNIIAKLRKEIKANQIENIDTLLHQLGLTTLVNSKSPTPLDEARNIIHICRNYYYEAIGELHLELQKIHPDIANPDILTLGFWPCGDRDGNPFVTHETTLQVIHYLRMTLMKCYYNDLKALAAKFTFKGIEPILQNLLERLYEAMFSKEIHIPYQEILAPLQSVASTIKEKYARLYLQDLQALIAKVSIFKNHFASLDIRQDMDVHTTTITEILKHAGIINNSLDELEENELVELLIHGDVTIDESALQGPLILDTIRNIKQLPTIQKLNGIEGCHRYIISNSEDKFSVLFVFALFRWIHPNQDINFDFIPLFETMYGMAQCKNTMQELFAIDAYRTHVSARKNKQVIMLGFSDGTKDGGYLTANWSIFQSKERLSQVCQEHGIKAVFFDGRGGPPARGGGKTHKFYTALGPKIANNGIEITIQGQTITSTYGTVDKFKFNAEQMISSGLYSFMFKEKAKLDNTQRALIEELSQVSLTKYKDLKEHPSFLPYLEKMTTLKYYSHARIGSRPSKRNKSSKLTLNDLRAISYVGSWSQLKQNIPGYFGIGTAIAHLKTQGRISEVQELYRNAPFFATLIDNCMMSLSKCLFELTAYMKKNAEFGDFWKYLYEEFSLSKNMILEITGLQSLMENEKNSRQSIHIREEIVLPLMMVQNYALQKIQSKEDLQNNEAYQKLVIRSLYGNINASRNSA